MPVGTPVGLTLFGLVELTIDASQAWLPAGAVGSTNFSIPNDPNFAGVEIKTQGAALVPGINAAGALSTNALRHVIDIS